MPDAERRPLLLIAHPGHELRLFGWLRRQRPLIVMLTDGSGSTGVPRIDLSERVVERSGGEIVVPGHFREPDLYDLILRGDSAEFVAFACRLGEIAAKAGVVQIICDAGEGYHPAHDLCLPLAAAAASHAGISPELREYCVIGDPRLGRQSASNVVVTLDDTAWREKIDCSRGYAADSGAVLEQEVGYMFATFGEDAFRHEVLHPAGTIHAQLDRGRRYYEQRGEEQVAAGRYRRVLRHAEHMQPIEAALRASRIQ
jgi:hypothetical protein